MIGRVYIFALCAAALAPHGSPAATVPQDSIGKYYFSAPYGTNMTGTVIGEPPAYRVLRREDIAWLREAACERAALAQGEWWGFGRRRLEPQFGSWPLAESNRFARFTAAKEWCGGILETNIVVGWNYVTNAYGGAGQPAVDDSKPNGEIDVFSGLSFGSGDGRFLAASSNDFLSAATGPWDFPPHTNIVTTVVTNWGDYIGASGYVPGYTTIVEHVSMAMTNGTTSVHTNSWTVPLPHVVTTVATNIVAGTVFDLMFAGGAAPWLDPVPPEPMRPFPDYAYVAESYGLLRQMDTLAELTDNTNIFEAVVHRWERSGDDWQLRPDTWTTETASVGLTLRGITIAAIAEGFESGAGRVVLPSRLSWDVVHTGDVCRIRRTDLYACVRAGLAWVEDGHWASTGGTYVATLGTASMLPGPQGGKVCFEATVDGPAIARTGAAALGLPAYSAWPDWKDDDGQYQVRFILIHHLSPRASLPGWNN